MANPIFIFGFARSGTTLLSMMVDTHPEIAVPFSCTGLWYRVGRNLAAYNCLEMARDVARLIDDLLSEERIRLWNVSLDRDALIAASRPGDYRSVVSAFHAEYARQTGKRRWGNIDIATLFDMDLAHQWFPDARFIHIVRDVRDVALSHQTMRYGLSNIRETAEEWSRAVHANLKMGAVIGSDRYLVIRYEDLILKSESTLQRICTFLDIPYSASMLTYPKMVDEKIPVSRRWLWPAIDKPPDESKVYRWRRRMGVTRRVIVEWIAGDLLGELGYETFEEAPRPILSYMLDLWYFLGRGHRFHRLAARLGVRRESKLERQWRKAAQNVR